MAKFTKNQLNLLKSHESVEKVTEKQVTFTTDFKLKATKAYLSGKPAVEIFSDENLDFLPRKFMTNAVLRWRDRYNKEGEKGLKPKKKGRIPIHARDTSELSYEELIAKVEYLEQENDFLKKLKALGEE